MTIKLDDLARFTRHHILSICALFSGHLMASGHLISAGAGHEENLAINEIVIRASRTDQSPSSWPGSVYTVDPEALQLIKARHISEALVRTPGVWVSRGNGQEHLTAIRSPVLTGAGACGAFLMAEDNIPLRAAGFCNVNQLFESTSELAERIEVLAGPQSVRYGTNAMHGLINIVSPLPDRNQGSSITTEAGSHDYYRATLLHHGGTDTDTDTDTGIGMAPQDWFAAFSGAHDGGYKHDSGFDQQKVLLRHRLQAIANEGDLRITSSAAFTNLDQETAGFIKGDNAYQDDSRKKENPNPEAYRDASSQRVNMHFDYQPNSASQWQLTPYFRHTDMEFLMHFLPWQPVEENSHTSVGWQGALRHQLNPYWIMSAGLDGEYTWGKLKENQAAEFSPTIPAGVHYDYEVDATVISPFVSLQWQTTSALSVSAGLRYEWLSYDYENRASGGAAPGNSSPGSTSSESTPCAPGVDCRFVRPENSKDYFNNASWQLGAVYQLSPGLSVFGNFSRAYRAPQTTELYRLQQGQLSADLDEETLDSFELGTRGQYGEWHYSLAAYTMKKDDVIFQDTDRQNVSGASTKHRGLDLALGWSSISEVAGSGWYASLNASYAKHSYDSDMAISQISIKGNDIDTAPRTMGSMQLGRDFRGVGKAELEWVYMGSYFTDPENQHSYRGHRMFNLRWQWQATPQWQFGLRINNMLDEDYADRADFGFGDERYFVGEPRTGFIDVSRQF